MGTKLRVGVLGATGTVGQRFVQLLEGHVMFELSVVAASERSAGQLYSDAAVWKVEGDIPVQTCDMIVLNCVDYSLISSKVDVLFSALDASVAGEIEQQYADMGVAVFTNAKNHRYDTFVPIILPQTNSEHIHIIKQQSCYKKSGGFIVANSNCATAGIVVALKAISDAFELEQALVCTLQAISGAGYPGIPSMDILDNVVPFISGEEEKIEFEPRKMLGSYSEGDENGIKLSDLKLSAMCHRVPVLHGHTSTISLQIKNNNKLSQEALISSVENCLSNYKCADPDVATLPSFPKNIITLRKNRDRPQPRLDRDIDNGMSVVVGGVRSCNIMSVKFCNVSHNTILGAAGGSLLNAELAVKKGYINTR